MRLPLAVNLESRDGTVTKDAKVKNGIQEVVGEETVRLRRRPGSSDQGLIRAGVAQWLGYWSDQFTTIQDDYINIAGGYTFATWNPLDKSSNIALTNGNLTATITGGTWPGARSTVGVSSGKHYWEITSSETVNPQYFLGVAKSSASLADFVGFDANGWGYRAMTFAAGGGKHTNNVRAAYAPCSDTAFSVNEVIGVALDMDLGTITLYRGGVSQGVMYSGISGTLFAMCSPVASVTANFGATPFTYAVPAGHRRGLYTTGGTGISSTYLSPATADLQFTAQDNGAAAAKKFLMVKSAEQAWVVDGVGNVTLITDVDYPSAYAVTLTGITRSGLIATATMAADSTFHVGDSVTIAGATPSDYNGVKVITGITLAAGELGAPFAITITRSGGTATATSTTGPHGLSNGQQVKIAGAAQDAYNGTFTIAWLTATTFSFTVTVTGVTSPATGTASVVSSGLPQNGTISITTLVATVTIPNHGLATGATVYLYYFEAGVQKIISGVTITVTNANVFTCATANADIAAVAVTMVYSFVTTVSGVTSSDGVIATATTAGNHGMSVGSIRYLQITGLSPAYFHNYSETPVTATSSTTFTWPMSSTFVAIPPTSPATPATGTITAAGFTATLTGASFTFSVSGSPTTPATGTITATGGKNTVPGIAYIDGYFAVMDIYGTIYNSPEDDPSTWQALEFVTALAETGLGKAIARSLHFLIGFKEYSTEFFYTDPQNETGSPFSPVPNLFTLVGCASGFSLADVAGRLLWISQSKKQKGRSVHMMLGSEQQKISTVDVERILNGDDLTDVRAYGISIDGHPLYVLTLEDSEITLVYDLQSERWGEWSSLTIGSNKSITSITRSGTTATVTFALAHGMSDGDPLKISGAVQTEYNGIFQASYVSTTVVTVEVTGSPATPATGTILGNTYTESYFKFSKYTSGGGNDALLHESDGHLYYLDTSLKYDAGVPIKHFARTVRLDGGSSARKKMPRISVVADSVSDTAMIRWSDDDCATFTAYRRVTLSDQEPMLRQCGAFKRRTIEYLHTGSTAPVVDALELEIAP